MSTLQSVPPDARSTLSAIALRDELTHGDVLVVDVRPLRSYNGWSDGDGSRGGHIPGAVALPSEWLTTVDGPEMERILREKGIEPGRRIVIVGRGAADGEVAAAAFTARGIDDVHLLDGGFAAWAADPTRPIEKLPRHQQLVHIDWLREVLAGERPEAAPVGRFLLFHVNFGVPEEYEEEHIPGALYLDTNRLEDPATWNRRSPAELERALLELGVTSDTTVVLYGRDTAGDADEKWPGRRAGQIAATRALLILRYAGVDDVRLLDGGYDWWVREGNPVETAIRQPAPVGDFGVPIPLRPEVIVDIDDAKRILADPDGAALVSVRTWREHVGDVSGYDYISPAGRIRGDVWGNCGTDAHHMQHYRNVDNTMRAYPEIAANWEEAGITGDRWIAFYCGTGWRASETWFYAWLQGWERIAVYDGGWFEWSQDPDANPIEVGEPATEDEAVA